jgi:hypothetical protein|nr:hypothetical protein [Kofleriaceae bacterium]
MTTSVPDWPTTTAVDFTCDASFGAGKLTVEPAATPAVANTYDDAWTMEAAQACHALPYGGTHEVAFR